MGYAAASLNGDITPSARRLTTSLRDIGYDFVAALADVVDNSVEAGAAKVDIEIVFAGAESYVLIADDGDGMTDSELTEALRFGSRRSYNDGDLGRYGLGLKTASLSQCRKVTVVSRRAVVYRRLAMKTLDIDHIEDTDRWEVIDPAAQTPIDRCLEWLDDGPGTIVFWNDLDRVLPDKRPEGGWARRRLEQLVLRSREYLGMVFHRFLESEAARARSLTITVNGEKVPAWNPFAPMEPRRIELPPHSFEVASGDRYGRVWLRRYVLPAKSDFSSQAEFDRLSGPAKWNRQQGLYIYRADRLIQGGGWSGIRAIDEHTKFARASLDFPTELDALFKVNVAKMRVALPAEVRTLLERPVHEVCHRADAAYRRDNPRSQKEERAADPRSMGDAAEVGAALMAAALSAGEHRALERIMQSLQDLAPEAARALGW